MIPILFEAGTTSFTTNGLGRLSDAISCQVTEEVNSVYELEMEYPVDGIHFNDITEDKLIYAAPYDGGANQIFHIYKVTRPFNGTVTVYAEHISYLLNKIICMPFTASSLQAAITSIESNAIDNPFHFEADKRGDATFALEEPKAVRAILGGEQGSLLDVYGKGEYEFDNYNVTLHTNRGQDSGITIRYGKNLTDFEHSLDMTETYTGIVPFWKGNVSKEVTSTGTNDDGSTYAYTETENEEKLITLPEKVVQSDYVGSFAHSLYKTVDLSSEFEEAPTEAQLRERAKKYVTDNEGWTLNTNLKISFVALWQTDEYKDIAALERVKLCDKVTVIYPKANVNVKLKVVKTVYNCLTERYNSIELGDAPTNLSKAVSEKINDEVPDDLVNETFLSRELTRQSELITGGLGGYVYLKPNANGHPEEILIMDQPTIGAARNVIRMNRNGIAFSRNGYSPSKFDTAWTIDGAFSAKWITADTMSAERVRTGLLVDEKNTNSWDLTNGVMKISSKKNGTETFFVDGSTGVVRINADSISISGTSVGDIAKNAANTAVNGQTQESIFNKLTNNGASKGIYLSNGQLYVNASYIQSGTLVLGGANNGNGTLRINNASGTQIGAWNNSGITINAGSIKIGSKTKLIDAGPGVYIASDGIALGNTNANSTAGFSVTNSGNLTAYGGTIKGATFIATANAYGSSSGGEIKIGGGTIYTPYIRFMNGTNEAGAIVPDFSTDGNPYSRRLLTGRGFHIFSESSEWFLCDAASKFTANVYFHADAFINKSGTNYNIWDMIQNASSGSSVDQTARDAAAEAKEVAGNANQNAFSAVSTAQNLQTTVQNNSAAISALYQYLGLG